MAITLKCENSRLHLWKDQLTVDRTMVIVQLAKPAVLYSKSLLDTATRRSSSTPGNIDSAIDEPGNQQGSLRTVSPG
jgi:hypothetical protein